MVGGAHAVTIAAPPSPYGLRLRDDGHRVLLSEQATTLPALHPPHSHSWWTENRGPAKEAYAPRNATVRIGYLTALDEPVRRTLVRESPGRVAIALLVVRSTPSSGVGIVRCLTVPLRHPLRHRLLIDGASGRPPTYHRGSGAPPIIFRFLHLNRRRCPPAPRIRRIS